MAKLCGDGTEQAGQRRHIHHTWCAGAADERRDCAESLFSDAHVSHHDLHEWQVLVEAIDLFKKTYGDGT